MKLVRCDKKKHYYDSDKSSFCPECLKLSQQNSAQSGDMKNRSQFSASSGNSPLYGWPPSQNSYQNSGFDNSVTSAADFSAGVSHFPETGGFNGNSVPSQQINPFPSNQYNSNPWNNSVSDDNVTVAVDEYQPAENPFYNNTSAAVNTSFSSYAPADSSPFAAAPESPASFPDNQQPAAAVFPSRNASGVSSFSESSSAGTLPFAARQDDSFNRHSSVIVPEKSDSTMSSFAREISSSASTVHVQQPVFVPPSVPDDEDDCKTISIYEVNDTEPVTGWLVCVNGVYFGESFKLKAGQNFVGRSAGMDVCLSEENSVSRQNHMSIIFDPESCTFYVSPGQSNSLTYVNNQVLLMPSVLNAFSEIRIGKAVFVFVPLCSQNFSWAKYTGQ